MRTDHLLNALPAPLRAWLAPAPDSATAATLRAGGSPWTDGIHLLWSAWLFITPAMGGGDYDVLFLCGIGEVFPYIRSHNVLNNLQSTAKDKPTVLFFPGEYRHSLAQGASLELFGLLHDDKYYRAFNIFETQA